MQRLGFILLLGCLTSQVDAQQKNEFQWPDGKKAAIVLTYDDGMQSQLNNAVPQLNKANLKGTFFLNHLPDAQMADRWRLVSKDGHELGNHTLFHPCSKASGGQWSNEWATENYTLNRLIKEIVALNTTLYLLDGRKTPRTFAYPCAQVKVAGESYVDTLRRLSVIRYARVGSDSIHTALAGVDTLQVASWGVPENTTGARMIEWVDKTLASGGLLVFQFHGIGGQWINVPAAEHQKLVNYLVQRQNELWIAPFYEVIGHVAKQQRKRKR